jgi:hypothetical protein
MTVLVLAWLAAWGVLVKRSLDRGLDAATTLCNVSDVTECNVLVTVDWKFVYLPWIGLLLILFARWWGGSDRRGAVRRAA